MRPLDGENERQAAKTGFSADEWRCAVKQLFLMMYSCGADECSIERKGTVCKMKLRIGCRWFEMN